MKATAGEVYTVYNQYLERYTACQVVYMAPPDTVSKQAIDQAAATGDKYQLIDPAYDVIDELEQYEPTFDAVRPILELLEASPNIDFGGPGSLGSFMEEFRHALAYINEMMDLDELELHHHVESYPNDYLESLHYDFISRCDGGE